MKTNKYFSKLVENNMNVDIKSAQNGLSVMYLIVDGKRLNDKKVYFKSNKENSSKIAAKVSTAREFTHLSNALKEIVEMI